MLRSTLISGLVLGAMLPVLPVQADPGAEATLASPEDDSAPCELRLNQPQLVQYRGPRSRGYEPKSNRPHMEVVTLKVAHRGEQCRYRIQIEPDAGASAPLLTSPSGSLEYGIQDGGPNVTADSRVEKFGMFSDMQREASHQFEIRVAPGQDVRAGRYTGHIRVSLFKDDNGLDTFQDERIVEVVADVAPTVSASFGTDPLAGSRSADIDFGVLSRNQSRSLQFSVAANTGYSLSLSSRERGRLKHEFTDFGIPYDLVLDGREIDLETAEHDQHLTGLQSSQHDLRFDVSSDPQTALAGFYSDQLTIVIAAQ